MVVQARVLHLHPGLIAMVRIGALSWFANTCQLRNSQPAAYRIGGGSEGLLDVGRLTTLANSRRPLLSFGVVAPQVSTELYIACSHGEEEGKSPAHSSEPVL